jgi:hypothetical protein
MTSLAPDPLAERRLHEDDLARRDGRRHLPARPAQKGRRLEDADVGALVEENASDAVDDVGL